MWVARDAAAPSSPVVRQEAPPKSRYALQPAAAAPAAGAAPVATSHGEHGSFMSGHEASPKHERMLGRHEPKVRGAR